MLRFDRRLPFLALLAATALATACAGDATPADGDDAGTGTPTSCSTHADCDSATMCVGGICIENTCSATQACPNDMHCDDLRGACAVNTSGGDDVTDAGGTDGGSDGGTPTTCASKYDCPDGQICKLSTHKCQPAASSNACNSDVDCPRGRICNFSKQCEAGCVEPRDCPTPQLCHPQKFVCEVCSLTNPCPAGQNCTGGQCKTAVPCVGPSAQQCVNAGLDGTVCLGGFCSNCTGHGDCRVDPYKGSTPNDGRICTTDGLCKKVTCTDANCKQSLGNLGYCDTATNQCATHGCLTNTDCSGSTPICDTVSYTCVPDNASTCDEAACDADCATRVDPLTGAAQTCNYAQCACGGQGSGAGCATNADCASGEACGLGVCTPEAQSASGGSCDATECTLGGFGINDPCVSAADPNYECDPTGCLFSLLFGGGGGAAPCL